MIQDMFGLSGPIKALASFSLLSAGVAVQAQPAFPTAPVTLVVGWPAGGPSDNVARLIANPMGKALRQQDVQKQLSDMGSLPAKPMRGEEFWGFVKRQMPDAAELVRTSGAKAE